MPYEKEKIYIESSNYDPEVKLVEDGSKVYLHLKIDKAYFDHNGEIITTEYLGMAKMPKAVFENPDGTPIKIDEDYFGVRRSTDRNSTGPFCNLENEKVVLKVW